ncbi:MAG TPA: hypothetical protein VFQ65_26480 [Kofleriaceae bacterium]|nr:hypothetical protein [Kofleriaceae bacterium]
MVVFSNQRLGASAEYLVSNEVALEMLRATAAQALPVAAARWEHELVRWLERRAADNLGLAALDVGEIAWTPDHFEAQRAFLLAAIARAAEGSEHGLAFDRWRRLIEAHPRDSVQVGRRWNWLPTT